MDDRGSLRMAARRYPYLQGLLLVPIGLWLAAMTLTSSGWWPWKGGWPSRELAVMLPATGLAGWGFWKAVRRYEERFGRVAFSQQQQLRDTVVVVLGVLVLAGAQVADGSLRGPVNLTGITFALLAFGYWKYTGVLRRDHLVLGGGVLVLSLMPWTTVRSSGAPTTVLGLAIAATIVGAGLLDHAELVRWLGPVDSADPDKGASERS